MSTAARDSLSNSPWLIEMKAADNALAPVITKGEPVAIDCSETDLVDGGIYAIKSADGAALWLFHEGFAGMGPLASGEDIGTLTSLAGSFRCSGPLAMGGIKVIGRLYADVASTGVKACSAERSLLISALEECRAALRRHSGGHRELQTLVMARPDDTLASWSRRYGEIVEDAATSKRFALEQRIDALQARLMFLEDRIADGAAEHVDDVSAKLQVLWDLHHAPFPNTHDDLSARIIASALRGLKGDGSVSAQQDTSDDASPAIKLVASPRRR